MAKYDTTVKTKPKSGKKIWLWVILLVAVAALAVAAYFLVPVILLKLAPPLTFSDALTVEAGEALPAAEDFWVETPDTEDTEIVISYSSDVSGIQTNVPGDYPVTLFITDRPFGLVTREQTHDAVIHIVDTIAPTGTVQSLTVRPEEMPTAADFVTDMQDVTEITVSFESEPSAETPDPQDITIVLTDTSGNETKLQAVLIVILDEEAPVIEGVKDIMVYEGGTVAYRSGVTVTDNMDEAPVLEVDNNKVDLTTPGEYQVTYIATDKYGNYSTVDTTVTVLVYKDSYVEFDVIYEKVDEILAEIITDNMTDREKAKAIYYWVRSHCGYADSDDEGDWMQAAYNMMKKRSGDCYNYFALCKLMFEQLGIPNIDVAKIPNYEGDSHHYWSLVSVDGGETYYHFDTTPRYNDSTQFLLVTDKFMNNYSAKHKNCFNRDESLYPATPEE